MIRSMTGFGSAVVSDPTAGEVAVELRSLNNRFLDLTIKMPREIQHLEARLRDVIKKRLRRGKVDMFIRYVPTPGAQALSRINQPLLRQYAEEVRQALTDLPGYSVASIDAGALLQMPGIIMPASAAAEDGPLAQACMEAADEALKALEKARLDEGHELAEAIRGHLKIMVAQRGEIAQVKDELLGEYRDRLRERIEVLGKTLDATLDPIRVETEIMFFADKSDITEELVRLDAHIKAFDKLLNDGGTEAVGKRMDFLVQELLRETNTIGNKARGVAVASLIVLMKSEIEKVREQVQNLE